MALSNDLIKEFASVIGGGKEPHNDTTCYGTVARMESSTTGYVLLDGAESETPANFTVAAHASDRVLVMLKNRSALVIGNVTHPVIMTGTLYASDAIVVEGYLTTNALRTKYNDTINGLTFDSNGIGAYSNTSSWWLKNDGTFQFGGNNGIKFSDNKVRFGSDVVLTWGSISDKPAIPTDIDDLTDNNSKLWTTTIAENWITTQTIYSQTLQVDMAKVQGKLQASKIEGISGDNSNNGGSYIDFTNNTMHIRNISADEITSGTLNVNYIGSIPNSKLSGTITGRAYTGATAWEINLAAGTMTLGQISADKITTGTLTVGGTNNGVGSITIKNASGGTIGSWDNTGITAEYGTIAGWKIEPTLLSKEVTISETVNGSTVSATYKPYIQALANPTASNTAIGVTRTVGSNTTWPFVVYYDGSLLATKANITGVLTAGANSKIGPWNVTDTALWYGTSSAVTGANAYKNANGLYFGTSGLSLKDKFYVTAAGVPHCNGADLFINSPVTSGNSSGLYIQVRDTTFGVIRVDGVGTTSQSFNVVGFNGNASSPVYNTLYLGGDDIVLNAESSVTINPGAGYYMYVHNTAFVGSSKTSPYTQPGIGLYTNGNLTLTYDGGGAGIYFAYNKAASYTVGLYESASGTLSCSGGLTVAGVFTCKNTAGNSSVPVVSASTDKHKVATLDCSTDTTGRLRIRGQWNVAGSTYTYRYIDTNPESSDVRLKDHIEDCQIDALPIINAIKIRQFDWIADGSHQNIGVVADELEKIDSRLAVGGGYEEDGEINIKSVNSFYLLGYVVKAIQELSFENKKLKEEISKLKGAA